jgi:hypothetical protein
MDIDGLLDAFGKMIGRYPDLPVRETKQLLMQHLPKFDTQDEAMIEALLVDRNKLLEKSFIESVENYLKNRGLENNLSDFLKSEEGQKAVIEIFLSVLQNLVDYLYHVLLTKQFGG